MTKEELIDAIVWNTKVSRERAEKGFEMMMTTAVIYEEKGKHYLTIKGNDIWTEPRKDRIKSTRKPSNRQEN